MHFRKQMFVFQAKTSGTVTTGINDVQPVPPHHRLLRLPVHPRHAAHLLQRLLRLPIHPLLRLWLLLLLLLLLPVPPHLSLHHPLLLLLLSIHLLLRIRLLLPIDLRLPRSRAAPMGFSSSTYAYVRY